MKAAQSSSAFDPAVKLGMTLQRNRQTSKRVLMLALYLFIISSTKSSGFVTDTLLRRILDLAREGLGT